MIPGDFGPPECQESLAPDGQWAVVCPTDLRWVSAFPRNWHPDGKTSQGTAPATVAAQRLGRSKALPDGAFRSPFLAHEASNHHSRRQPGVIRALFPLSVPRAGVVARARPPQARGERDGGIRKARRPELLGQAVLPQRVARTDPASEPLPGGPDQFAAVARAASALRTTLRRPRLSTGSGER